MDMKIVSAIFLVLSLWLAVLFGGQTEAWSWGPALLALALSVIFRLGSKPAENGAGLLWCLFLMPLVWIAWRCSQSPVLDFARADFMLILTLVGAAWVVSGMDPGGRGIRLLYLGLAISVIANVVMAAIQWRVPEVMWPYAYRPSPMPTGFFGHYNYFANFVVGVSLLLLGRAFLGDNKAWQRVVYGLPFLGALVIVPLSGSRGGLMALGIGSFVLLLAVTIVGWREKKKWLPVMVITLPLVAIGGVAGGWFVISKIQDNRGQGGTFSEIADNSSRLEWMGLAMEVAKDHWVSGGGSRCYSWERNAKLNQDDFGYGQIDEPFVHNELLQVTTDYGLVGAGLVLGTLLVFSGVAMAGLFLGDPDRGLVGASDSIRVGVAGGASALIVQSNLSFVFHMLPSVMLLGLMFGLIIMLHRRHKPAPVFGRWLKFGLGVLLVPITAILGWKASMALHLIWPVIYEKESMVQLQPQKAMDRLEQASHNWPGFRLLDEKASWARTMASDPELSKEEKQAWNQMAMVSYQEAFGFHPFNPQIAVNLGNTCAELGLADEAEEYLERAIELQGGLEAGFRARYFLARHLYEVWHRRWLKERRAEEAMGQFLRAQELLETADPLIPVVLRNESAGLKNGVAEAIKFLEGAGVRPAEVKK